MINEYNSKFIAAERKGIKVDYKDKVILYLGASHGVTCSYLAKKAKAIFALDFAPSVVRELYFVAKKNKKIIPILEDANKIDEFKGLITGVDIVIQDIAQKNQLDIFLKNCAQFLEGVGVLFIKSRSIDVTKDPDEIYYEIKKKLGRKLVEFKKLDPYVKDHAVFVVSI